jgi:hypothetical protein
MKERGNRSANGFCECHWNGVPDLALLFEKVPKEHELTWECLQSGTLLDR